jgi:hypothetical protein
MFRTLLVHHQERRYISCILQLVYAGASGRDVITGRIDPVLPITTSHIHTLQYEARRIQH